jgi:hypothetical protein
MKPCGRAEASPAIRLSYGSDLNNELRRIRADLTGIAPRDAE